MAQPLVMVVILNTNRREDTLEVIGSLEKNTYTNSHVIVLDNASNDGSVEAIQATHPQVQVIQLEQNLGYAGNNNVGIKAAIDQGADWVFVLNEDTILAEDCIQRLVEAGEQDTQTGFLGPMVYHHDEPEIIQSAGGALGADWQVWHISQNEPDRGQYNQLREVDWISGCAIVVRRQVIDQIGALDARFFYYYEETEWCIRASKAGWKIVHVPQAKLWHKGVQRNYRPGPSVTYYATRNRFLMLAKHKAPLAAWFKAWEQVLRTLLSWSIRPKWRSMHEHREAMWQGTMDFLRKRWGMRVTQSSVTKKSDKRNFRWNGIKG